MFSRTVYRTAGSTVLALALLLVAVPDGRAQLQLELSIADVIGYPDGQDIGVEVFMNNYTDTVAGFKVWFQVDKPNMASFQIDVDTVGTLISGWDVVDAYSESSQKTDLVYLAIAEYAPPYNKRGIPPQAGGLPLLRLRMSVEGNPDPYAEPVVAVMITPFSDLFEFVDPVAGDIGRSYQEVIDTSYYQCLAWVPPDQEVCMSWAKVPSPPYDSMGIDTVNVFMIDYDKVALHAGSMAIVPGVCGDIDGSFDREVDISDVQRLVDHLFLSLDELPSPMMGNADGSTNFVIDISDLQVLISHLFIGLEEINCGI